MRRHTILPPPLPGPPSPPRRSSGPPGPSYPRVLLYAVIPCNPADGERSYHRQLFTAQDHAELLPGGAVINEYTAELRTLGGLLDLLLAALNDGKWYVRCRVVGAYRPTEPHGELPTPLVGSIAPASAEVVPLRRSTVQGMGAVRPEDEPTTKRRRTVPPASNGRRPWKGGA